MVQLVVAVADGTTYLASEFLFFIFIFIIIIIIHGNE